MSCTLSGIHLLSVNPEGTHVIELLWNNPISETKMTRYTGALELQAGRRVIDFGCGCGEVLIRLTQRFGVQPTGIDSSPEHIAEARRRAEQARVDSPIDLIVGDVGVVDVESGSLDVAICLGSSHAFGGSANAFRVAIERMSAMVRPGGRILIADGYMKQPAAPEYRSMLGDSMPDEMTHAANVATGRDAGLIPLGAWTSSEDEWDEFEWTYQRVVERHAHEWPNKRDVIERLTRRRQWMDAYLSWGRDTLGFGIYLFQRREL